MKKSNTPRRKRLKKAARLARAKDWIKAYTGKHLVKGYSRWFGVDMLCALSELKLSGVAFTLEAENQIIKSYHQHIEQKRNQKQPRPLKVVEPLEADENFGVIIGLPYTPIL